MRKLFFLFILGLSLAACQSHRPEKQLQQIDSLRFSYMAQESWIFHPVFDSLQFWHSQWVMQQNTWKTVMDSAGIAELQNEFPVSFSLGSKMEQLLGQHQTLKTIYDVDMANMMSLKTAMENGASQDLNGNPLDENYWIKSVEIQTLHQDSVQKIAQSQIHNAYGWMEQVKMLYPLFQNKIKEKE